MRMSSPPPSPAKSQNTPDPLQLLLESHQQMRKFAALAAQLGKARGKQPAELSEAASQIIRYFTLGMPMHAEDEDYSLAPRLFDVTLPPEVIKGLWEMARQHEDLERAVDELLPAWVAVRDTPERHRELAAYLTLGGRQLMSQVEEHLSMEEQRLFPLIRERLDEETLAVIAMEILDRRGQLA
ncbi:hemerythrin domain-containing protein [Hyalangium rubrum]|uniref:Hemerythrin domain-containing protein n=1 Tax=Hyalangium rubrum TaxID=3103134 RepID=A0ABU5H6F7_9BACT|nr:hemerythrin domain-containing protein [Hyalangium sp. s54d21]MDY7228841.1 hemerythrin domain-containing protein [Hyalangium sp. s54d21]